MTDESPQSIASPSEIALAVAPLAADPRRAGAFFDLDGTLAPIVDRPENASVPSRTRELIARIAERFAVAGIVSGRRSADAREILGLDDLIYVGNHGFEVLRAGAEEPEPSPALKAARADENAPRAFLERVGTERIEKPGLRLEDKGVIRAIHWRGAPDEVLAEAEAEAIAADAQAEGLLTHRGRKVIELRPAVEIDKGKALEAILDGAFLDGAFYAGDDRTDADGFRALGRLVARGVLETVVTVAVVAGETPPEVADAADIAVAGPAGFVSVLEALA